VSPGDTAGMRSFPGGFTHTERRVEGDIRGESRSVSHCTIWTPRCYPQGPERQEAGATLNPHHSSSTHSSHHGGHQAPVGTGGLGKAAFAPFCGCKQKSL